MILFLLDFSFTTIGLYNSSLSNGTFHLVQALVVVNAHCGPRDQILLVPRQGRPDGIATATARIPFFRKSKSVESIIIRSMAGMIAVIVPIPSTLVVAVEQGAADALALHK